MTIEDLRDHLEKLIDDGHGDIEVRIETDDPDEYYKPANKSFFLAEDGSKFIAWVITYD